MLKLNENAEYDVVGIGSALLDFTIEVDDSFLSEMELKKGEMHLIDAERSSEILKRIENYSMETTPGGSCANTLAGVLNFDGRGIFLGAVGNDSNGDTYINETEKTGVKTGIGRHDSINGHAITFITSDSERTFATHLGAALDFSEEDVAEDVIKKSKVLHLEGYLFEPDNLNSACMRALDIAKNNGVAISIDLSDPALISRIRGRFDHIVKDYADIIFVNEDEALAFTGKSEEEALNALYEMCDVAVVKLGAEGSLIKADDKIHRIPPVSYTHLRAHET